MRCLALAVLVSVLVLCVVDQRLHLAFAQDPSACYKSPNCDEFIKCCEEACPSGATPICRSEAPAPGATAPPAASAKSASTKAPPAGEMAFMAGAAPEESDAPAPAQSGAGGDGKIAGAQCLCHDQKSFVTSMTMACLMSLDAPDKCGDFEKCCKDTCSKFAAYAFICGQEPDGAATSETECICFNSVAALPGWAELEKSKDGGEASDGDKGQYEDHNEECFNSTTTCEKYNDCCTEACKRVEYSGNLVPVKMCVGNKRDTPMKSTHTFCRCPKTVAVFGVSLWSDGTGAGGPGEVASVFKGGNEVDDGIGRLAPASVLVILTSIAAILSTVMW